MQKTESQDWLVALFAQVVESPAVIEPAKRKPCSRCSGSGRLSYYSHVKGGECFACHGTGVK
tara:strand:+ start:13081 stop:13266 length:186 start_codon:yes stop_codon:yes gene_type:complete